MTSNKKGTGFPGSNDDDELAADFDAWDENFGDLFADVTPPPALGGTAAPQTPRPPGGASAAPADEEADFVGEPEVLGPLLGTSEPPPLAPPPHALDFGGRGDDEPMPLEPVLDEPPFLPPVPVFASPSDDDDEIFTSALRPEETGASASHEDENQDAVREANDDDDDDDDLDLFGDAGSGQEVTRIVDVDSKLLEAVAAAPIKGKAVPLPKMPPATAAAGKRPASSGGLRSPAIVRRQQPQRAVFGGSDDDEDFSAETTKIADAGQIESLMVSAEAAAASEAAVAEAFLAEAPDVAYSFEVDDDFYADISIGDSEAGAAPAPAPVRAEAPPASRQPQVTRHVVRREVTPSTGPRPAAAQAVSAKATADKAAGRGKGRSVDPEITLDLRVTEEDLGPPEPTYDRNRAPTRPGGVRQSRDVESGTNASWPPPGLIAPAPGKPTDDFDIEFDLVFDEAAGANAASPPAVIAGDTDAAEEVAAGIEARLSEAEGASFEFSLDAEQDEGGWQPEALFDEAFRELDDDAAFSDEERTPHGLPDEPGEDYAFGEGDNTPQGSLESLLAEDAGDTPEDMLAREPAVLPSSAQGEPKPAPKPAAPERQPMRSPAMPAAKAPVPGPVVRPAVPTPVPGQGQGPSALARAAAPAPAGRVPTPAPRAPTPAPRAPTPAPRAATPAPLLMDQQGLDLSAPMVDASTRLDEVDVAPELPAAKLVASAPELVMSALALPAEVAPATQDLSEEMAEQLLLYEREIEAIEEPAAAARIRLEAGRLAEKLGDPDRARSYFEEALHADPRLAPAIRALRRIERLAGNWSEAVRYLDAEIEEAGDAERPALRAHRVSLLMASGEHDLARVAVGEILDADPHNLPALLAQIELALGDSRPGELGATLARLTELVGDARLKAALALLRGRLAERELDHASGADLSQSAEEARLAYQAAAEAGSKTARLALARVAERLGAAGAVADALASLADLLAASDPATSAALSFRAALWAGRGGRSERRRQALERAFAVSPGEPLVCAELAEICAESGDHGGAAQALMALAEAPVSAAEQAYALTRAAEHLAHLGDTAGAVALVRRAVALDPTDPIALYALEDALAAAGDTDALIDLDRQAYAADPGAAVFERVRAARRLAMAGRYDEAASELAAGREAVPEAAVLVDTLLDVLAQAGRSDQRILLFAELSQGAAEHLPAEVAAERWAYESEDYAYALEAHLAELTESEDADPAYVAQVRAAREQAAVAALEAWQQVVDGSSDPGWIYGRQSVARIASMLGDIEVLDDALAELERAATSPAHAVSVALRRAALQLSAGQEEPDLGRAEDVIRNALSLASGTGDARAHVAQMALYLRERRLAEAAGVLLAQAALVEDAGSGRGDRTEALWLRLRAAALHVEHMGHEEDGTASAQVAAEILADLIAARPDLAIARELFSAAEQRMDRAEQAVDPRIGRDPRIDGASWRLIREGERQLYGQRNPLAAAPEFQKALSRRPEDAIAAHGLVRAAEATGDSGPLTELVLANLRRAEERGDSAAKADAYEELANIDGHLRGDASSALFSYQSALELDGTRVWVLRALERAYIEQARLAELAALYGQLASGVGALDPADQIPLALVRAHLASQLGAPDRDALYRAVYDLDPKSRQALVVLEALARREGQGDMLVAYQSAIADYFADAPRARAAFLTRAGETLLGLGLERTDAAIERLREGSDAVSGYEPALFAWRVAALRSERWDDVASAAIRAAELADTASEQVYLYHVAGVTLMDRLDAGEQAATALAQVLEIDPGHEDAFMRLRAIFGKESQHERLAELLRQRVDVAEEPIAKAQLHRALADLCAGPLGNRSAAKEHLRAVLSLYPNEPNAVALLSEIAWEQGAWQEAADALSKLVRLESDREAQKRIFSRLGVIYAERLPEVDRKSAISAFKSVVRLEPTNEEALDYLSRLAMESGDFKLALGACEQLIKQTQGEERKVERMHRAARIYAEGFGDRAKAERAYRAALDIAPTSDVALKALVRFFEDSGDIRSARVHINRVIGAMRSRIAENMEDGVAYRAMARMLEVRQRADVAGSLATARCAAELALLFDAGEEHEENLAHAAVAARPSLARFAKPEIDELLFPPTVVPATRELFRMLGDRIAKHVGADVRRYQVARGDRLRRREDPPMVVAEEMAGELGLEVPVVYVSNQDPGLIAVEPTSPVSIVLGSGLMEPSRGAQLRFAIGRSLKLAMSAFAVPARMSEDEFGVFVVALLKLFDAEVVALGLSADLIAAEQQRLRRLIPTALIHEVRPFAMGMAGENFDYRAIHRGIQMMANRAGLLACGSVRAALSAVCGMRGFRELGQAAGDPVVRDLMQFAVSEDHASARGALDEGGAPET